MLIQNNSPKSFICDNLHISDYYDDVDIMHFTLPVTSRDNIYYDYTVDEGDFLLHFDTDNVLIDIEVFDWKKRNFSTELKGIICIFLDSYIDKNMLRIIARDEYGIQEFRINRYNGFNR